MGYANVNRPMGGTPYGPMGKQNAFVTPRNIPAVRTASGGGSASTNIAIGDFYSLDANGNAFRAGPNDVVRGLVIGFRFLANQTIMGGNGPVSVDFSLAGANDTLLGLEDGQAHISIQADTFALTNAGGKFNLADAAPDTTLAQSRQTINIGGGAGSQFQVISLDTSLADNAVGANARIVVRMLQTFNNG